MTAILKAPEITVDVQPSQRRTAELVLVALPSAISCARLLLDISAYHWRLDAKVHAQARDVLDELVAHAVATTGVIEATPVVQLSNEVLVPIGIRLVRDRRALRLEVWDTGNQPCEALLASSRALGGHERWGVEQPSEDRRVVWCVIGSDTSAEQTARLAVPLTRRTRTPVPKPDEPVEAVLDPVLLQRILDGLRSLDAPSQEN